MPTMFEVVGPDTCELLRTHRAVSYKTAISATKLNASCKKDTHNIGYVRGWYELVTRIM